MRRRLTLLPGLLLVMTSFAGAQRLTAQPLVAQHLAAQPLTDSDLLQCIRSFNTGTISSAGRESAAASMLKSYFPPGTVQQDRLGNLVITIGSGNPRRLLATTLDEPAYVISDIQPDGYCRVTPIGASIAGIAHQFVQGNPVLIQTSTGPQYGVAIVPSTHFDALRQIREDNKPIHPWQETILDLGCSNAEEVAARGIHLFDPVTTLKTTQIIGQPGGQTYSIAGPNIRVKSAVIALAAVARTLLHSKFTGTVTIAFTALDDINGKGWEGVRNKYGPFDETARFGADFQLPASYAKTPVEQVQAAAIRQLITDWLDKVDRRTWEPLDMKPLPIPVPPHVAKEFVQEDELLSALISRYGVGGAEAPVRDYILSSLPPWAHPVTDEKGNIVLTFGKGSQHIAFVAHMDEVGFVVDSILDNGTLRLRRRGGFYNFIWEGHAAILHTAGKEIPALFEPRPDYLTAKTESSGSKFLMASAGFTSKQQAIDAGIRIDATTVTMPKQLFRLTANRAAARGFDDRVGCAALLLALHHIDPATLPFTVTFVFSTGEEIGLLGSTFAAKGLQDCDIVYPIDTFVSSDDPVEPHTYAYCPLGKGAVIRVIESINIARRSDVDYVHHLAEQHHIAIQEGMTSGGTDGQGFLSYDIPSVPLSWPGRYSHSPVEVMDFRDLRQLVAIIRAIMQDTTKKY